MNMDATPSDNALHADMSGSFTFADNELFRGLLKTIENDQPKEISLNLSAVDFVDSAALGMLLLLRDIAEEKSMELTLQQPQGQVKKMFDLSQFDSLFTIK